MPLDVCAFVAQGDRDRRSITRTASAITPASRSASCTATCRRRTCSCRYAGEVKLVDFGIAKATMKARQTAVGVIKGKYYYMSPEQAWGDPIDYRSDIFSAGIVLYEMITGQMLYLEEDLHKLLDMARKADIAPPSKLRKGVPPQLERIVMHALAEGAGRALPERGRLRDRPRALPPRVLAGVHRGEGRRRCSARSSAIRRRCPTEAAFPSIEVRDGVNVDAHARRRRARSRDDATSCATRTASSSGSPS